MLCTCYAMYLLCILLSLHFTKKDDSNFGRCGASFFVVHILATRHAKVKYHFCAVYSFDSSVLSFIFPSILGFSCYFFKMCFILVHTFCRYGVQFLQCKYTLFAAMVHIFCSASTHFLQAEI